MEQLEQHPRRDRRHGCLRQWGIEAIWRWRERIGAWNLFGE
uniref:Uncharacterized protein n=1 Tax=Arundo donax TaxID=35708 RepID=A0A0A9HDB8_ARUDO